MRIIHENDLDQFSKLISRNGGSDERMKECKEFAFEKLHGGHTVYFFTDCDEGLQIGDDITISSYFWTYYLPNESSHFIGYALIATMQPQNFQFKGQYQDTEKTCGCCCKKFRICINGFSVCACDEGLGEGDGPFHD